MVRKLAGNGGARLDLDGVEQTQRQLSVVAFFVRRVGQLLHVEVGEDADQRRTHIDAAAQTDIGEAVETRQGGRFHHTRPNRNRDHRADFAHQPKSCALAER